MQFVKAFSVCGWIFGASVAFADSPLSLSPFFEGTGKLNGHWVPFSFAKIKIRTQYEIVRDPARGQVLHAVAEGSASALRHSLDHALDSHDTLKWSWKIGEIPTGSSAKHRETDDFAARLYITFAYDPTKANTFTKAEFGLAKSIYGDYPPMSAISYIVEPNLPIGTIVDNPFTSRVKMIVVDNGKSLGQWQSFERNLLTDYKRAFGEPPATALSGIVLMTDADNTHTRAEAWYGDISLSATK